MPESDDSFGSLQITPAAFDRLVQQAVASLPPQFKRWMENVIIAVQEEASEDLLDELEADELLGVYLGVPLTERHPDDVYQLPDQILLFRGPLVRACDTLEELEEEIRITVVHEVGHFFGLSEEEIVDVLGP